MSVSAIFMEKSGKRQLTNTFCHFSVWSAFQHLNPLNTCSDENMLHISKEGCVK